MYIQTDLVATSLFSEHFVEEEILQNSVNIYISDLEDLSLHDNKEICERSEESNAYKKYFHVQGELLQLNLFNLIWFKRKHLRIYYL
jgi:hypothetical protein